jgi:hypothetical protein
MQIVELIAFATQMMRVVALQTKFEVQVVFPVVLVLQMERTLGLEERM